MIATKLPDEMKSVLNEIYERNRGIEPDQVPRALRGLKDSVESNFIDSMMFHVSVTSVDLPEMLGELGAEEAAHVMSQQIHPVNTSAYLHGAWDAWIESYAKQWTYQDGKSAL